MIRVLCVDDHPAVRAGLMGLLKGEPGFVAVGAVADETQLWPALHRTRPDVVLLDHQLPGRPGVVLCHRIKATVPPPGVIIYSAFAPASLSIPARLARADALVAKGLPVDDLFDTIRLVARGDAPLPAPSPRQLHTAGPALHPEELPIFGMLLEGTPRSDIAAVTGIGVDALERRTESLIVRLAPTGT